MSVDHRGLPGVACTEAEALCPLEALVEVARPNIGRGFVVILCDEERGGCGRSTLPHKKAKPVTKRQLVASVPGKPWRDGPAPWAR